MEADGSSNLIGVVDYAHIKFQLPENLSVEKEIYAGAQGFFAFGVDFSGNIELDSYLRTASSQQLDFVGRLDFDDTDFQ